MNNRDFESDDLLRSRKILSDAKVNTQAIYEPLGALGIAIVVVANGLYKAMAEPFDFKLEGRPSEPQIYTFFEFLYFFAHLALRTAVKKGFKESQIKNLQAYIGPLLASTAVDSFFLHWPTNLKTNMRGEFFEKLNDAELEYSTCRMLYSADDPLSEVTLVGKMARNVSELLERSGDKTAQTMLVDATLRTLNAIHLEALLTDVLPVIDSVDIKAVNNFWKDSG